MQVARFYLDFLQLPRLGQTGASELIVLWELDAAAMRHAAEARTRMAWCGSLPWDCSDAECAIPLKC
jgi:hypothetical protein